MDNDLARYIEPVGDLRRSAERHERSAEDARPREFLGVLRRHRLLLLACTVLVPLVTYFITRRLTPVYEASASIRVDLKQPSLPVLDALQGLAAGNEVATEMAELQSRMLMEEVVVALALRLNVVHPERSQRDKIFANLTAGRQADSGLYRLERKANGRFRIERVGTSAALGEVAVGQPGTIGTVRFVLAPGALRFPSITLAVLPFEHAVDRLENTVKVLRPSRDANIIAVRYEGTDPQLVTDVSNAMATRFIARRQSVRQTETRSTVKFLREQLGRLATQLAAAEDTLRAFRVREQIVDLQEEGRSEVSHVAELQAQRNMIDAERAALAKLLDSVRISADHMPADAPSPYRNLVAFPTLLRNQAASELLSSLTAAEDRRNELLTRRTMRDPDVQLQTARIRQLENQLRLITMTYLQGLTDQEASYDALLGQSSRQLQRFPNQEIQLARLQRQVKGLDDIYTLLQTRLQEAEVAEAVQDASVRVVDAASVPLVPIRPKPMLNLSLAIVSGLLLGISVAFAREYADNAVHTRNQLRAVAGTPVLGLIPHYHSMGMVTGRLHGTAQRIRRIASRRGAAPAPADIAGSQYATLPILLRRGDARMMAEAFQRLATNIGFARAEGPIRRLMLTSPLPGDGKTIVAVNVALALAQRGKRVLLVDADLRRGRINTLFRMPRVPGLWEVIQDVTTVRQARQAIAASGGTLHVLATGSLQENPASALAGDHVRDLFAPVAEEYDLIVFDTPPINVVTDAALLASSSGCDGVIVVVRSGVTAMPALTLTVEQLRHVHAPILGAVLNDIDFERDATYDGSYRYYGHNIPYEVTSA
jgi:capsular exopolysaccharide synthesis family protein